MLKEKEKKSGCEKERVRVHLFERKEEKDERKEEEKKRAGVLKSEGHNAFI